MDPTVVLPDSRKQEILAQLQEERTQRKRSVLTGEEYHIDWDSLHTSTTSQRKAEASHIRSEDICHHSTGSLKLKTQPASPAFGPCSPAFSLKSTRSVTIRSQMSSLKGGLASAHRSRNSSRSREMDVERIRTEMEQQWTFQPNTKKSVTEAWGTIAPEDVINSEREEKWERLSKPKTKAIAEREKQRKTMEDREVEKCSFRPHVSQGGSRRDGKVEDRLFREAVMRVKERRRLQAMNEEYVAAECTFSPRTYGGNLKGPSTPIYQRLSSIVQQRDQELASLRAQISAQEQSIKTYHPAINPTSASLAHSRSLKEGITGKDVVSRMEAEALRSEWRKAQLLQEQETAMLKQCSFSPRMHPGLSANYAPVIEKVKVLSRDEDSCTFHPLIDSKSREIAQRKDALSWDKRLTNRDGQKQAAAQHRANLEFRKTHSFVPLSQVTKPEMLTVPSRYRLPKKTDSDAQTTTPREDKAQFRPAFVSSPRSSVKSEYAASEDISENVARYARNRERRIEQYRMLRDVEEADKCPFFPATTNCTPSNSKSPPPVKGLESFYSHVDRANRLKNEAKKREEEVFKPSPRPQNFFMTVPKPFNLRSSERHVHTLSP